MAEEDLSSPDIESRAGLLSDDILSRVYEGGFKTWECSLDLANYLSTSMITGELVLQGTDIHIIEVWSFATSLEEDKFSSSCHQC